MDSSSPELQIYALAERARFKFVGHMDARDHNLRILIAHARLYDDLSFHVEELRARKFRKSTEKPPKYGVAVATNTRDTPRPGPPHPCEDRRADKEEKTSRAESASVAECAVLEDDDTDIPLEINNCTTIDGIDPERSRKGNINNQAHGSPTVIEGPATFAMINHFPVGTSQTVVHELPLEDSSSSDSSDSDSNPDLDSDSDSNSDFDFERDRACGHNETGAKSITISRPKSPHIRTWVDDDTNVIPKCHTSTDALATDDTLPAPERIPPALSLVEQDDPRPINNSLAPKSCLTKTSPLSPILSSRDADVSSNLDHDRGLQDALLQLRDSCSRKPTNRKAIHRWLATFAHWTPTNESCMIEDDVNIMHDEKVP